MTGHNSKNMSMEDKLVQVIMEGPVARLIDDPDAVLNLTNKAINTVLFGGPTATQPSSVVMKAAQTIADTIIKQIIDEILLTSNIKEVIQEAFVAALPNAIQIHTMAVVENAYDSKHIINMCSDKMRATVEQTVMNMKWSNKI